jgi:hypothetical protein
MESFSVYKIMSVDTWPAFHMFGVLARIHVDKSVDRHCRLEAIQLEGQSALLEAVHEVVSVGLCC